MSAQIIRVEDARAMVRVGVPDPERAEPQEVRVSVAVALAEPDDFRLNDRLSATLDYDAIIAFIHKDMGAPAHLIETLAERVAAHCLALDARVQWAEVTVKKPSVLKSNGLVSITLRRTR